MSIHRSSRTLTLLVAAALVTSTPMLLSGCGLIPNPVEGVIEGVVMGLQGVPGIQVQRRAEAFRQLGHGPVDPLHAGLEQHAQCPGATAFLQRFTATVVARDVTLQLLLLLLQAAAGALLQSKGLRQLLDSLTASGQLIQHLLLLTLQALELLGCGAAALLLLSQFLLEFSQSLLLLAQALRELQRL